MQELFTYRLILDDGNNKTQIINVKGQIEVLLEDIDYITSKYLDSEEFLNAYRKNNDIRIVPKKLYIARVQKGSNIRYNCIFNNSRIYELSQIFKENGNTLLGKATPILIGDIVDELIILILDEEINEEHLKKLPGNLRKTTIDFRKYMISHRETLRPLYEDYRNTIIDECKRSYKNIRSLELLLASLCIEKDEEEQQHSFEEYYQTTLEELTCELNDDDEIEDAYARQAYSECGGDVDKIFEYLGEEKILSLSKKDKTLLGINERYIERID